MSTLTAAQLPGLDLWIRPSDDLAATATGTAVSTVPDHGPGARAIVAAAGCVARQNVHNGRAAVDLSGSSGATVNAGLTVAGYFDGVTPITGLSLYMVYRGAMDSMFGQNADHNDLHAVAGYTAGLNLTGTGGAGDVAVAGDFNIAVYRFGTEAGAPVIKTGSMLHDGPTISHPSLGSVTVPAGDLHIGGSYLFNGQVFEVIWCRQYHDDATALAIRKSLYLKYEDTTKPIVFVTGNSLINGYSAAGGGFFAKSWPPGLLQSAVGPGVRAYGMGLPGRTYAQLAAALPAMLAPYAADPAPKVATVYEGTNTINSGLTATQTNAAAVACWSAVRPYVGKLIAQTTCAFAFDGNASSGASVAADNVRLAHNAFILANYAANGVDAVVDTGSTPHLANLADAASPAYYDGGHVHLTASDNFPSGGYAAFANAMVLGLVPTVVAAVGAAVAQVIAPPTLVTDANVLAGYPATARLLNVTPGATYSLSVAYVNGTTATVGPVTVAAGSTTAVVVWTPPRGGTVTASSATPGAAVPQTPAGFAVKGLADLPTVFQDMA